MSFANEEVEAAWRRILTGDHWPIARASLVEILVAIGPDETGALQRHEGRRSLAAQLLALGDATNPMPGTPEREAGKPKAVKRHPGRRLPMGEET